MRENVAEVVGMEEGAQNCQLVQKHRLQLQLSTWLLVLACLVYYLPSFLQLVKYREPTKLTLH